MRIFLLFVLAALAAGAPYASGAGPQVAPAAAAEGLTASERALVEGSREAIIKTGLSANFFDGHFRVARVVDRPGDRRVVWKLSVGGYEATVNDSVGFYTEAGRRVDTHSVAGTLASTSDITRTLTRRRAETIMRRCIGRFSDPQVEYRANGPEGRAALLLTASSVVPPPRESRADRERREREEREARERAQEPAQGVQTQDVVPTGKKRGPRPVILLGAVDLSTGRCTVGRAQAGSPTPDPKP